MHSRRLPPLDPLRGFAAAARYLSFTQAAAELHLTQSAVSRQVQALEDHLAQKLFVRKTRRLELTAAGEALFRATAPLLDRLAEVCETLRSTQQRPRVNLTASLGIASLWLVPRLAAFQEQEPEVDVRLSADNRVVDLEREGFDLALRYMNRAGAPPDAELLFEEEVFPVAAPKVAARASGGLTRAALAGLTLLEYDDTYQAPWFAWPPWLTALDLASAKPKNVLRFNHYDQLIQAAVDGRGVALGRGPLVAKLIAQKKLRPIRGPRRSVPARGYFLVRAAGTSRPEVARFAQWLLAEARTTSRAVATPQGTSEQVPRGRGAGFPG